MFDDEIKAYVDEIWTRTVDANEWVEDGKAQSNGQNLVPYKKWFNTQLRTINSKFEKYMSLSH
ncbi:hypothetical protein AHAT_22090 [Agarivorans sp. Toyoura001]|uniref:hypothetical protein n=1 Tax=Agarivorans sp. Toyoura001 TaxID=2283141 RepID=UPI0010E35B08|nr:hypothetical protein [Agarivorans sp. Toyoura001]GDY26319.1 hypothetical protein AHAT_22090 [Agarivorans sp. Toyoura001]